MKKIALTGNIGSGKSTAARVFEILGIPIYNADIEGHHLLRDKKIIEEVEKLFGDKVIKEGKIDRKALAGIVFKKKETLVKLNAIIHPRVIADFNVYAKTIINKNYVIFESAIIFEYDLNCFFDESILVFAPFELKIKRVMERDNCNRDSVIARLSHQIDDNLTLKKSNHIINNDDIALVIPQVLELHRILNV